MNVRGIGLSLLVVVFGVPAVGQAQDKVYRSVPDDAIEKVLKGMDLNFRKSIDPKDMHAYYDFLRDGFDIRLHNYNGKDLWIDCIFNDKANLDTTNKWNVRAKFSRAVLLKGADRDSISLESQLDCISGTTEGIVRQYVQRFMLECRDYSKFVTD